MGFDIYYNWQATSADTEARNEALAAALLSRFSSLRRVPLDLDAIAISIDVPRNEILAHWCQIELNAEGGEIGQAIITLWLDFVAIAVPSRPEIGIEAKLQCLESLFDTLTAAGLASDPAYDLAKQYQLQQSRVEHVARIVGEGGDNHALHPTGREVICDF